MLLKLAMKYGEVTTGDVMIRKTGMFVFLACLLAGCDNAKDLPLLGRYVAKNVCASLWLEGYEQGAAVGYVTNVAPLIQPSWKVTLEPGQVRVNSFWFPWFLYQYKGENCPLLL